MFEKWDRSKQERRVEKRERTLTNHFSEKKLLHNNNNKLFYENKEVKYIFVGKKSFRETYFQRCRFSCNNERI